MSSAEADRLLVRAANSFCKLPSPPSVSCFARFAANRFYDHANSEGRGRLSTVILWGQKSKAARHKHQTDRKTVGRRATQSAVRQYGKPSSSNDRTDLGLLYVVTFFVAKKSNGVFL
jgi:hypothetical protein